jgi:signal transduction histidine kinase/FixJ family two-component response regulator
MQESNRLYPRKVLQKLLAAFLLAAVAISLALAIARFSFRELMTTVENLSEPNEKLTKLNKLFEEITTLDQLQRAEAIENPRKPYESFIQQSASLRDLIDSLKLLPWETNQWNRLEEMKGILADRNELFFSYLKVKADLLDNKDFSIQLDTLSAILQKEEFAIDSSVIKTHKKTITTWLPDTNAQKRSEQRSFLKKLFSSKKKTKPKSNPKADTMRIRVDQQLDFEIDTIAVARQNEALIALEKMMRAMDKDQRLQRQKLQAQELELIQANSLFINQLLNILHEVENEELRRMQSNNEHAVRVMNQSINRYNILTFAFILVGALLVYFIAVDISRSNFYKEQLEKARDKAEQLSQIKQRFLANMSHEIRTPLQSIIGFAEQLKQKYNHKEEAVDAIHSSSEHLLHIVNEVLDYSRISSGTLSLAKEKFRLLTLIKEVESAMRIQAERKNLTFLLDTEKATEYIIIGDPFRLRQILYNLLGNAIKFTHHGFVKLALKTYDEGQKVLCVFEVTDTGIGIDKVDQKKIFKQFEQANAEVTKHYGGTGLGLTIVKTLVDAHEGVIELNSEIDVGSMFRIEIRFDKAPILTSATMPAAQPEQGIPFKGKVFVIDDDGLILRLCSLILKKNEIEHLVFNQAREVLHHPVDSHVTHIFMDIRMPDINGVDLCHALRKLYPASTRFIALTAHVLPEEKELMLRDGFDYVLTKPFHEHELINILGLPGIAPKDEDQPDFSLLRKMTLNDETLFQSIITQFVDETIDELRLIREKVAQYDALAVREIVHKMAGRFSQLGVVNLASALHNLEEQLVAGKNIQDLEPEIQRVSRRINDVIIHIRLTTIEQLN